jgi:hypothetical protein
MPYVVVDNFSGGLDSRRHVLNSKSGTLSELVNAHITRGGEIEKRKAFVQVVDLDTIGAQSFGLEATNEGVYVFGSQPAPASMPSGFIYQRLQHPTMPSFFEMTKVVFSTVYGGNPFVIAEFTDNQGYNNKNRVAFYDGVAIKDWYEGYSFTSEGLTAAVTRLAGYVGGNYSSSTTYGPDVDLFITGPSGKAFTVSAGAPDGINPVVTTTQNHQVAVGGTTATASFVISAGSEGSAKSTASLKNINGNALPDITGIYVNGVEILGLSAGSGIRWDSVPNPRLADIGPSFAYTLWTYINNNTVNSNISASYKIRNLSGTTDEGDITIKAPPEQGGAANGWIIQVEFASNPTTAGGYLELANTITTSPYDPTRFIGDFAGGVMAGGVNNDVTSVKVDGIEIMGSTQAWKGSHTETMQGLVSKINAFASTPEYTAALTGGKVVLTPTSGPGSYMNGRALEVETTGNVIASSVTEFAGGVNGVPAGSQISRIRYAEGTTGVAVAEGSKFSLTIIEADNPSAPIIFGASRVAGLTGNFSVTYKAKEYLGSGSTLYFSAVNDATKWDIYDIGSGFIDMSNNFGGREDLTGAGVYQNYLAVFSRRNVQLWGMDADPAQNRQVQVLANTGAIAPDSIISVGSIDLLYLADNGVRSVRARESTDTAYASDIGSAVDSIIIDHMTELEDDYIAQTYGVTKYTAKAVIEPIDGRYWLSLGNKIFVLSAFQGSNIAAWSVYDPGFMVSEMVTREDKVYLRSAPAVDPAADNKIFVYGGVDGQIYDDSQVVVELPYLDANKPATYKEVKGMDATIQGTWQISMGYDHTNPEARDIIATPTQPTFALGKIPATGIGTHFGLRLVNEAEGYARLANIIVHYDEMHSKHDAG